MNIWQMSASPSHSHFVFPLLAAENRSHGGVGWEAKTKSLMSGSLDHQGLLQTWLTWSTLNSLNCFILCTFLISNQDRKASQTLHTWSFIVHIQTSHVISYILKCVLCFFTPFLKYMIFFLTDSFYWLMSHAIFLHFILFIKLVYFLIILFHNLFLFTLFVPQFISLQKWPIINVSFFSHDFIAHDFMFFNFFISFYM